MGKCGDYLPNLSLPNHKPGGTGVRFRCRKGRIKTKVLESRHLVVAVVHDIGVLLSWRRIVRAVG